MAVKKKTSSNSPSKKQTVVPVAKSVASPDDQATDRVTLRALAKRCGVSQHAARVRLNKAGVKRPGSRWVFKAGSAQLTRAVKILSEQFFS